MSTFCRFTDGPRAGQIQDYAPRPPVPIGTRCHDGQGSTGIVVVPPAPRAAAPPPSGGGQGAPPPMSGGQGAPPPDRGPAGATAIRPASAVSALRRGPARFVGSPGRDDRPRVLRHRPSARWGALWQRSTGRVAGVRFNSDSRTSASRATIAWDTSSGRPSGGSSSVRTDRNTSSWWAWTKCRSTDSTPSSELASRPPPTGPHSCSSTGTTSRSTTRRCGQGRWRMTWDSTERPSSIRGRRRARKPRTRWTRPTSNGPSRTSKHS